MNDKKSLLFFDSGIGGLTVLKEVRLLVPDFQFIYVADNAGFPYGVWKNDTLKTHILKLFEKLLTLYNPALCVIACNTVSTLMITDLRQKFPHTSFVGTVPAIKTAAEQTKSGFISVLATPGTIKSTYTHELINSFARQCDVRLIGSEKLAGFAENYLLGKSVDCNELHREILPCFIEKNGKYTDVIVLACTHYPFLIDFFRKQALWPVEWIDSAKAVAKHTKSLLIEKIQNKTIEKASDFALFTSQNIDFSMKHLLQSFGFNIIKRIDFEM
ncbi:glutamate racemase [Bartonella sp. F02]|uniref:glutamate racemase n=1 Tax=Bartonella sp. F02 TaxID=2967262 RepID=UPI0022A93533|nr:glutamate racemase [Bartonella sp. F02]MCZ2328271.1 glutamate racemase [Bartonella sp. F02]